MYFLPLQVHKSHCRTINHLKCVDCLIHFDKTHLLRTYNIDFPPFLKKKKNAWKLLNFHNLKKINTKPNCGLNSSNCPDLRKPVTPAAGMLLEYSRRQSTGEGGTVGVGCRCGWHLAFWIENKLTEEIGGTTQAPFLGFRAGGPNRPLWPQHSEAILLPRLGRREGGPAFLHRAPQAWLGRTFLLPNSQQSVPQKEPVYLEAKHIPPPVGSSPPLFRAASREALCWSKTSKNEASGPLGVKAIRTPLQQKRPTTRAPPGLRSPFSVPTMHLKGWGLEGQSSSPELGGRTAHAHTPPPGGAGLTHVHGACTDWNICAQGSIRCNLTWAPSWVPSDKPQGPMSGTSRIYLGCGTKIWDLEMVLYLLFFFCYLGKVVSMIFH